MKNDMFAPFVCVLAAAVSLSSPSIASASVVAGFLNDPTNTALVASDGYLDLQAPRFANDDEIARNVAVYELTVGTGGTIDFTSTGYANSGAQPYFTLFSGTGTGATFLDSSYFDANIDFSLIEPLTAGSYLFAVGVYFNMSFAENNPDADPTIGDGFTALGDPTLLGNYLYQIGLSSRDGASFDFAPATGIIPPPGQIPEPATYLLVLTALFVLVTARRTRRIR